MGSVAGVLAAAARRVGLTVAEYEEQRARGLKRCIRCRTWLPLDAFGVEIARGDGLTAACRDCRHVPVRRTRIALPGSESPGHAYTVLRDAIQHGILPPATTQTCACGRQARNYHHANGYENGHEVDVVPMCVSCHRKAHWNG